jgi:ABC-type antimicrobial peptide transport system permease subunit
MFVSAFALLALVLAVVGLYGVMAYVVTLRTREFGIRTALGGDRRSIVALILRDGLTTVGIGAAVGIAAALAAARLLAGLLQGVTPRDPLTFAGAAGALLLASVAACLIPARRAGRINPVEALRME